MKKVFLALATVLLAACSQSNEDKAEKLIQLDIVQSLNDPKSYEAVEVKVDSAFYDIHLDNDAIEAALRIIEATESLKQSESSKAYNQQMMNDYKKLAAKLPMYEKLVKQFEGNYNGNVEAIEKCESIINQSKATITEISNKNSQGQFCGWLINHKYRCANINGGVELFNFAYIADSTFQSITKKISLDDESVKQRKLAAGIIDQVIKGE